MTWHVSPHYSFCHRNVAKIKTQLQLSCSVAIPLKTALMCSILQRLRRCDLDFIGCCNHQFNVSIKNETDSLIDAVWILRTLAILQKFPKWLMLNKKWNLETKLSLKRHPRTTHFPSVWLYRPSKVLFVIEFTKIKRSRPGCIDVPELFLSYNMKRDSRNKSYWVDFIMTPWECGYNSVYTWPQILRITNLEESPISSILKNTTEPVAGKYNLGFH